MKITLLCYATFAVKSPENSEAYPISEGETVTDVLERVGIPIDEVKIVFINGKSSKFDAVLQDGDRVGVFPAVGGG
ncbi:MoaD/ThiS family protein [Maridesulfovibrio salexigens]|uniref:ThiamineS protein n=1 Tax=Maridesulfovibrio salexigens (strain ATCC 14822 / DSM 2638 / NCIMB 8403 / VKM B-1763) TaxID=526222 RepID=C6BWM3_MARSD|nr:MoaD/ThiS family protein [Maridesulfovibrio salexigens]ACS80303.1 thiamineS protein [Maridesulfovibrio salexigens DSM 2638]